MGIGYNAQSNFKNTFYKNTTQKPIIGWKTNDDIDAHTYDGYFDKDILLAPGAWIQATMSTDKEIGNNPNTPNIFKCDKSTTDVSGVLLFSDNEVHGIGDQSGTIRQGQLFKFASQKSGVETYLSVHTDNAGDFVNASLPIALTFDIEKGGVKKAQKDSIVVCYAISNLVADCQELVVNGSSTEWKNTFGVKVRF